MTEASIKVIAFNGPPRAGKDECCKILQRFHPYNFAEYRLATPLYYAAAVLLGEDVETVMRKKDALLCDLDGTEHTRRDLLIKLSEDVVKPWLGRGWWASVLVRLVQASLGKMPAHMRPVVLVPDLGFPEEVERFEDADFDLLVVQVQRPGTTYEGDSRGWCAGKCVYVINNNGDTYNLEAECALLLKNLPTSWGF